MCHVCLDIKVTTKFYQSKHQELVLICLAILKQTGLLGGVACPKICWPRRCMQDCQLANSCNAMFLDGRSLASVHSILPAHGTITVKLGCVVCCVQQVYINHSPLCNVLQVVVMHTCVEQYNFCYACSAAVQQQACCPQSLSTCCLFMCKKIYVYRCVLPA